MFPSASLRSRSELRAARQINGANNIILKRGSQDLEKRIAGSLRAASREGYLRQQASQTDRLLLHSARGRRGDVLSSTKRYAALASTSTVALPLPPLLSPTPLSGPGPIRSAQDHYCRIKSSPPTTLSPSRRCRQNSRRRKYRAQALLKFRGWGGAPRSPLLVLICWIIVSEGNCRVRRFPLSMRTQERLTSPACA